MPDYAEVNASPYAMTSFHGSCRYDGSGGSCSGSGGSASCNSGSSGGSGAGGADCAPAHTASSGTSDNTAPYASTTLVVRSRPSGSGMVSVCPHNGSAGHRDGLAGLRGRLAPLSAA